VNEQMGVERKKFFRGKYLTHLTLKVDKRLNGKEKKV